MSVKVCLPPARVIYSHLVEPSAPPGTDKLSYSVTLSFPSTTDISKIQKAVDDAAKEKWGNKVPKNLTLALKENDTEQLNDEGDLRFGFHEGGWSISAKQEKITDVTLKNFAKEDVGPENFYAGCWVQAVVNLHAYKVQNAGVTCYLKGLRFLKDDEKLGSGDCDFDDVDGFGSDDDVPF